MKDKVVFKGIKKKARVYYDKLNDLLHVFIPGRSVQSLLIGDIAMDVDRHNKVIGIEITNASDVLRPYKISKEMLAHVKSAKIIMDPVSSNTAYIALHLYLPELREVIFPMDLLAEGRQVALT